MHKTEFNKPTTIILNSSDSLVCIGLLSTWHGSPENEDADSHYSFRQNSVSTIERRQFALALAGVILTGMTVARPSPAAMRQAGPPNGGSSASVIIRNLNH